MAGTCSEHPRGKAGCSSCGDRHYGRRHYDRQRDRAIANGTWLPRQPFKPVAAHVRRLMDKGMTLDQMADASGIPAATIGTLAHPASTRRRKYVTGPTAAAITAIPIPATRVLWRGRTDVTGTRRRSQALAVAGMCVRDQALAMNVAPKTLHVITANDDRDWCLIRLAEAMTELYDRLTTEGIPRSIDHRTIPMAIRRGWHGPDAWDEDTIDDPKAKAFDHLRLKKPRKGTVSSAAVWAALGGGGAWRELTVAERVEVVTILAARQWPDDRIGKHLRASADSVSVFRTRHGIESHYQPIAAYAA